MMSLQPDQKAESGDSETYFNAIVHPYRSMGRAGLIWLLAIVGLVMFAISVHFYLLGAWPIVGFAGVDILLLYWAFRRSFRDTRQYEQITITHSDMRVIRTSAEGNRQEFSFNPYWVRLETSHEEDKGMTRLTLTSHGRRVEVGAFLHSSERESLAGALSKALFDAKYRQVQVSGG